MASVEGLAASRPPGLTSVTAAARVPQKTRHFLAFPQNRCWQCASMVVLLSDVIAKAPIRTLEHLRPGDKHTVPSLFRSAIRTPEDSEVVAVVEFNLRVPRHSADNPASQCRKRIRLHFDSAGIRKAGALDESKGPEYIRIQKKQGFITISQCCHDISQRKQLMERDHRHNGK